MSAWSGFTEEELRQLKQQDELVDNELPRGNEYIRKSNMDNRTKRSRPREKIRTRPSPATAQQEVSQAQKKIVNSKSDNDNSKMSTKDTKIMERKVRIQETLKDSSNGGDLPQECILDPPEAEKEVEMVKVKEVDIKLITPEELATIEMTAVEKMQEKQKEMEELNKKKKLLLQQTIKQRYRRTQAEAATLGMVQSELAHLDSLLTADVTILREKIDEASRNFHYAQKRYEKAEKEFVAAKVDLHRQEERKEELTEHLYSIIQENEKRKAAKLEELMARLNLAENMAETVVLCETEGVQTNSSLAEKNCDQTKTDKYNSTISQDSRNENTEMSPQTSSSGGETSTEEYKSTSVIANTNVSSPGSEANDHSTVQNNSSLIISSQAGHDPCKSNPSLSSLVPDQDIKPTQ